MSGFFGASFRGANLSGANLQEATVLWAQFNEFTKWPTGFDTRAAGAIMVDY